LRITLITRITLMTRFALARLWTSTVMQDAHGEDLNEKINRKCGNKKWGNNNRRHIVLAIRTRTEASLLSG